MEHGAGESPNDEDDNRAGESPRATEHPRRTPCETSKSIANHTNKISRPLLFVKLFLSSFHSRDRSAVTQRFPVNARITRIKRINPSPPLGQYPQPEL